MSTAPAEFLPCPAALWRPASTGRRDRGGSRRGLDVRRRPLSLALPQYAVWRAYPAWPGDAHHRGLETSPSQRRTSLADDAQKIRPRLLSGAGGWQRLPRHRASARDGRSGGRDWSSTPPSPGTRSPHRSFLPRPDRPDDRARDRQRRRQSRGLRVRRVRSARASWCATCRSRCRTGALRDACLTLSWPSTASPASRASTPAPSRAACASAARSAPSSPASVADPAAAVAQARKPPVAGRPRPGQGGHLAPNPTTWDEPVCGKRRGAAVAEQPPVRHRVVAYDFGIKRGILRRLRSVRLQRDRGAGADAGQGRPGVRSPTGIFLSNGPGDPAARRLRGRGVRASWCRAGRRMFGICLGHQILGPGAGRQDLQAQVRPPRRQPPGHGSGDTQGGDHLAEPRLRGRRRIAGGQGGADPRQPERQDRRGHAPRRAARVQRAVPPRGLARPQRPELSVRPLRQADGRTPSRPDRPRYLVAGREARTTLRRG